MTDTGHERATEVLIQPLIRTGRTFYVTVFMLLCGAIWGLFAWIYQLAHGLGATGMSNSVTWGVYITNFVFFIGISHAGTLISAVLRVSGAEWRRPITRAAEAITVFALIVGGIQVVLDLGQPQRLLNCILYGRLQSPLLWDILCVSIYLLSCVFYLLLPLIPDMGALRHRTEISGWRRKLYQWLSFRWQNSPEQKRRLEKVLGVMAVAIIPIAVSVHTVVSWIFGMTVRPMWHSSIFGPYFVVGAIFSGIAALIIAMTIIRKVYGLEDFLQPMHFNNLGVLLVILTSLWLYFTFSEFLTVGYGALTDELAVFNSKVSGPFSPFFWTMVACMTTAFVVLLFRKKWVIGATTTASVLVIVGMWLERFMIVVPTLTKPASQGYNAGFYHPTWVEWSITAGSFCGFVLLYVVFTKIFPVVSIWELHDKKKVIADMVRPVTKHAQIRVDELAKAQSRF